MGTLDNIRPLTPSTSSTPVGDHRYRKPRVEKPARKPRRDSTNEQKDPGKPSPHIDEYA